MEFFRIELRRARDCRGQFVDCFAPTRVEVGFRWEVRGSQGVRTTISVLRLKTRSRRVNKTQKEGCVYTEQIKRVEDGTGEEMQKADIAKKKRGKPVVPAVNLPVNPQVV